MSFTDHLVLWLHVVAAIFTTGPGTAAIMSPPRYIRNRNTIVVGYLYRITRIYVLASLLTLILGLIITQLLHLFSKPWISTSITLYVVAFVLLVLIMRDQRKAIAALAAAERLGDGPGRSEEAKTATPAEGTPTGDGQPATTVVGELKTAAIE